MVNVSVMVCVMPSESTTLIGVEKVPLAWPATPAALRFMSTEKVWVAMGALSVPTGTGMSPIGWLASIVPPAFSAHP